MFKDNKRRLTNLSDIEFLTLKIQILKMKFLPLLAASVVAFERKPTGGIRPCDFYRRTAKVEFKGAASGTISFVSTSCGGKGTVLA